MIRSAGLLFGLVVCACAVLGDEKDPVKEKLFAAKVVYDKEMSQFRTQVGEWFDKREETARKAGDKKTLDLLKGERKAFDDDGELPRTAPAAIQQKPALARKALDAAYGQAVKDYTKAKKDDEAAAVERALLIFRKDGWKHLDLSRVEVRPDHLRIPSESGLPTLRTYTGGVEIVVVARTEAENIRLHAQRGSVVIFNWEVNPRELRVCRPDGGDKPESGSVATAKVAPLKPNTWYTIKWRLTEGGMQISVDGAVVFEEQKRYDLSATAPITINSVKSAVDIKEFRVTPLGKDR
jgi:hypothetical protein